MEMDTLQKLIETRAANRLIQDMKTLQETTMRSRLVARADLQPTLAYTNAHGKSVTTNLQEIFQRQYNWGDSYFADLYNNWLPVYVQEESEAFLKEFDQLKERFQGLQEQVDNLPQQY